MKDHPGWSTMSVDRFEKPASRAAVVVVLALLLTLPTVVRGKSLGSAISHLQQRQAFKADGRTWNIRADTISYDRKQEVYNACGRVRIWSEDRSLQADEGKLDLHNRQATMTGHVVIHYGHDWLKGEEVVWNLDTETGWMDGGLIYFSQNGFYVRARKIVKTGTTTFSLDDGSVSTCDPSDPDWSIRFKHVDVDQKGKGVVKDSRFYVRHVPILFSPYLSLPLSRDRKSGLLTPGLGLSKVNGIEVEIPFYWSIRQDMDATFFAQYLQKRGLMTGVEYRVNHSKWGEGVWLFNYLRDHAGADYLADKGYPFQQKDRFWFRARHEFNLPYGIDGYLDLDWVSDENFLKEFKSGSASYQYTNRSFSDFSVREILNDDTIKARENSLYLVRRSENMLLGLDTRYWDDLDRSRNENTLQQLPSFEFDIAPLWLNHLPFYYSLESSTVNYWRQEGDRGWRIHLAPRLYYPLHLGNYLDLEPSVGVMATGYQVDWQDREEEPMQGRLLSDVRIEMSSRLNRVIPWNRWNILAFQHVFRPEVIYELIPDVNQDDLPNYDQLDRVPRRNALRYGFTTFITSKDLVTGQHGAKTIRYQERARLRVSQAYQFQLGDEFKPSTDFPATLYPKADKHLSDVDIELDLTPGRFLTLSYDLSVSPDDELITYQDLSLSFDSLHGHNLQIDYRSREGTDINELMARFRFQLLPNLSLYTYHDYSFDKSELFEHSYGITYNRGCWLLHLGYKEEGDDQRIMAAIDLRGIGHVTSDFWK